MLLATINATERTDLRAAENELRQQCERAGLDASEATKLVGKASDILARLLERGNQLVSAGGQLRVRRKIQVDGHTVKLIFLTTGSRPGLLERVFALFG